MLLPRLGCNHSEDAVGFANKEGEGGIWELISGTVSRYVLTPVANRGVSCLGRDVEI